MTTRPDHEMQIDRVVVNGHGNANPPHLATTPGGQLMRPDVLFVRDDGWTLGAPSTLERVAQGLWPRDWVEVWKREGETWTRVWAANREEG